MQFLDRLQPAEREHLMAAGRQVRLARGEYLIRRGEAGGDIFLVEEGSVEVVDTRSSPEVVLDVVGPGAVVGEMSFLDEAPRAADVRAVEATVCRVWGHDALELSLGQDPAFSAAFHRALASTAVDRLRQAVSNAVAGGIGNRGQINETSTRALGRSALRLAASARRGWQEAELRLRRDELDQEAQGQVSQTFDELVGDLCEWSASLPEGTPADAGVGIGQELQAYTVRSRTGELALDPDSGRSGSAPVMEHVLRGQPVGDGGFGVAMDRAILNLPTCRAFRRRAALCARTVAAELPDRPARILVAPVSCGLGLGRLLPSLEDQGAEVTWVDHERQTLSALDEALPVRPTGVSMRFIQEDLVRLVTGRSKVHLEPQDFIVVDGLTEYLPDRLVAAFVRWCRERLVPGGQLVLTGLSDSRDAAVFDTLLQWPLIRRDAASLRALVEAGGLRAGVVAGRLPKDGAGVVVRGRRRVDQSPS